MAVALIDGVAQGCLLLPTGGGNGGVKIVRRHAASKRQAVVHVARAQVPKARA